ncbi:endonuclease-reverse transcriptase [Plakobranchus ocellatus]|uniref:Endonuclease-reverse transcriptase n=1 Tax=Plakobranchus ocellatus TaxID=259542 RepID=A0AAV4C868_9GAST|nr:endonuclease-reverse transcriptase [Plakobranchus ocellatus]
MRGLENHPGVRVGGQNMNSLRYADDTVLVAGDREDLQKLLGVVGGEGGGKGLELNSGGTEVMVVGRERVSPGCDMFINRVKLRQTGKFKCLGTVVSGDGGAGGEVSAGAARAGIDFRKMKTVLTGGRISIGASRGALRCYMEPVLVCGCGAWTVSRQIQNGLEATEMWFLGGVLRMPWTAGKTGERVLNGTSEGRSLVRTVGKRRAAFLGHVMRRGKLEHLVTTGKFEGKGSGGRQGERLMDGLPHGLDQEKCQIYWPPSKIWIGGGT